MRKTAKVLGIISTSLIAAGILLKMIHFPGGAILVILGVGLFAGFFLPILSRYKGSIATTKIEKLAANFVVPAGSLMALGSLFIIQFWPGQMPLFLTGILLSIVFLILHFISLSKYEPGRKKFGVFDLLILVSFVMLFAGIGHAINRALEKQKQIATYNQLIKEEAVLERDHMLSFQGIVDDTAHKNHLALYAGTNEILDYVTHIRGELIGYSQGIPAADGDTLAVNLIRHPDDFDTPTHYFIGAAPNNVTGKAKELKEHLIRYYQDYYTPEQRKNYMPTEKVSVEGQQHLIWWEDALFYHKTIIESLNNLTRLKIDILTAEKKALKE